MSGSEQRVDEGGDAGDADEEEGDEEQEHDDGDDPPGLVLSGKGPEFAEETAKSVEGAHGDHGAGPGTG